MKTEAGFTMLELVFVIVLTGIVAAVAVPNFIRIVPNHRLRSAAQDLYANLQKAKLAAVKRNRNAAVTFTGSGYTVFVDEDADFLHDAGSEEVVAQVDWSQYPKVSVNANTFDSSGGQPCIAFRPNGLPAVANGGLAEGGVRLGNPVGGSHLVDVFPAGSVRIQ